MAFEKVGVEITIKGVAAFERGMRRVGRSTDKTAKELKAAEKRAKAFNRAMKLTGLALVGAATAAAAFLFRATRLAARVQTLGVVTVRLGQNIGKTEKEIRELEEAIQDQGITMRGSREAVALMIQSQIDLAKGTELARLAQNAAVIANVNSTEAFQRLVFVITSGNVKMARTLGLQVNFQQAYKKSAEQLGKTSIELTELEKIQARTNAVLETGTTIAGAYSAAMETAGKKVLSLDRHVEDSLVILGESFLPLYSTAVDKVTEFLEAFEDASRAQQTGTAATIAATAAYSGFVGGLILVTVAVKALIGFMGTLGVATAAATAGVSALVVGLGGLLTIMARFKAENKVLKEEFLELFKSTVLANKGYDQYIDAVMEAAEGTVTMKLAIIGARKSGRDLRDVFIEDALRLGMFTKVQFDFTRGALKAADAFLDTGDAAEKSGGQIFMSADAYVILQQRLKEFGEEEEKSEDKTKDLAAETAKLGEEFQTLERLMSVKLTETFGDWQGKVEDLTGTISALEDKRYLTPAQREDLQDARDELEETNKAWREHTTTIVTELFKQALAIDGFTREEIITFAKFQESQGLVDAGYAAMVGAIHDVAEADIGADAKIEILGELIEATNDETIAVEDLGTALDQIADRKIAIEIEITTRRGLLQQLEAGAQIPAVVIPIVPPRLIPTTRGGATALQAGGFAQRGRAHMVGEGGRPEIFVPGMSGMVLPNAFVKAVSQVTSLLRGAAPGLAGLTSPVTSISSSQVVNQSFALTVNSQAQAEQVTQDFRAMQALANAF